MESTNLSNFLDKFRDTDLDNFLDRFLDIGFVLSKECTVGDVRFGHTVTIYRKPGYKLQLFLKRFTLYKFDEEINDYIHILDVGPWNNLEYRKQQMVTKFNDIFKEELRDINIDKIINDD